MNEGFGEDEAPYGNNLAKEQMEMNRREVLWCQYIHRPYPTEKKFQARRHVFHVRRGDNGDPFGEQSADRT